jgi:hypothetical protein
MERQGLYTAPRVAGGLLITCFLVFMVGGVLFWARNGMAGQPAPSFAYLALERGFVMAAAVITAIGLLLFAIVVGGANGDAFLAARLAAITYAIATALLLVGEAGLLRSGHFPYGLIVAYVVLAFLAQAALGGILIRTGFLPAWIGWAAIGWNIAWLVALAILSPGDIYFPVLHHTIPLLIGIALLRRG